MNKILICIPTYNERENIPLLYQALKNVLIDADILFCDDNSPDGTGRIIDALAKQDSCIKVIHRAKKLGLGTAHCTAYDFAREHHYTYLLTMDADFTHDPAYIPSMIAKKECADIVIGSRYSTGGSMEGWNRIRLPFTLLWRTLIKHALGMPYDSTGAFRLYNVKILNPLLYKNFTSQGFSFGLESLYHFKQKGATITEVPIQARNRQKGKSKLSIKIMREFANQFLRLAWHHNVVGKKAVS